MDEARKRAITVLEPGESPDLYQGVEDAAGIVAGVLRYDRQIMDRAPNLTVIARTGIGYDSVDLPAATERGILVCNNPDGPTVPTAEHTMALMLAVSKGLVNIAGHLRGDRSLIKGHSSVELAGKRLGLVGFGRIARRVASAAAALGMEVTAYDPYLADDQFEGVRRSPNLDGMLARAEVVSIHVPLSEQTRNMFDQRTLHIMKEGAILINAARGGLVNTDALVMAVTTGPLRAAGLDVTDPEPLPPDHPLLHLDNVLVTPHVASWTQEAQRRMLLTAVDEVQLALSGRRPAHLVNPQVLEQPTRPMNLNRQP